MKSLKLNHQFAREVAAGKSTSTWRINDDKDLHVNEDIQLVDKVDPLKPESWQVIGVARITSILEKQIGQVTQADAGKGKLPPLKTLITQFRTFYGQQVNAETPVKIINFTFQVQPTAGAAQVGLELQLYSDGGSRGNPGPSACGYVLMDMNNQVIEENGLALGVTTNNQAEYQSLKLGLEAALAKKATVVHSHMDSMLVVNQMKGVYKVKNTDLVPLHQVTTELVKKFAKVTFDHVPRERNRRADAMVNQVLDAIK